MSVVDTWWQLDNTLDGLPLDGANDVVNVEESVFPLPTALIPKDTMAKLRKAVGEHRLTDTPISKCIRMDRMDLHMLGSTAVSAACNHSYILCEMQTSALV